MACTVKPSSTPPAAAEPRARAWRAPPRPLAARCRGCSATPPTSLLCVICGDRIFSTAGSPTSSAAAAAASASGATTRVPTTGTPQAASTALASGSLSHSRPRPARRPRRPRPLVEPGVFSPAAGIAPARPGCGGRSAAGQRRLHRSLGRGVAGNAARPGRPRARRARRPRPASRRARGPGGGASSGSSASAMAGAGTMAVGACMNSSVPAGLASSACESGHVAAAVRRR
jgi:hypothetical protein